MIEFRWCENIRVNGHYFIEGILGLDWFPSDAAKNRAAQYERDVIAQLDQIVRNNYSGLAVINAIGSLRRSVVIVPDRRWEEKRDAKPLTNVNGWPDPNKIPMSAINGGANSYVQYSPNSPALQCHAGEHAGRRADEVLLHELVHAMRFAQGIWEQTQLTTPSLRFYANAEEFLAILITNIYMSEKQRGPLRSQWITTPNECDVLSGVSATSNGFLADADRLKLIARLYRKETDLFNCIAMADAPFNPIAEYVQNRATYEANLPAPMQADN